VRKAAKRGVFAYIVDGNPDELQSVIEITLQRFTEYQSLQGAFGRRALIERAKGILMARHAINADRAFELLRNLYQHDGANWSTSPRRSSTVISCAGARAAARPGRDGSAKVSAAPQRLVQSVVMRGTTISLAKGPPQ